MNLYLGEKIKALRMKKGISQEKLAQYLNVSFQAVSKWENSNTYPDITLLPEIARFFGITVDELLQVEKLDEQKRFAEYEQKACDLFRNGDRKAALAVWKEAYHAMPNNLAVKEMLMSAYFDVDKITHKQEIIELGSELYNASFIPEADHANERSHHSCAYYRGQAIDQLARTYAASGDMPSAEKWAERASLLMHSQEFIFTEITHGKDLLSYFRFANDWYFKNLFYMACRVVEDEELTKNGYHLGIFETLAKLYDVVYPEGDMEFEMMAILCTLHRSIAEAEATAGKNEAIIREHLTKACRFAEKSLHVTRHRLTHPLFKGLEIDDAPADKERIARSLQKELAWEAFNPYQSKAWYAEICHTLENCL